MQDRLKYSVIFLFFLLIPFACKREGAGAVMIEAEYIKYKVKYMDHMAGDIPTILLPDIMEAYYTKKYIRTRIHGYFGQFSLIQIANLRKNTVITMLNFFGTKVVHYGEKGEVPAGIAALNNPSLEITADTLTICGMVSTRGIVRTDEQEYDIYFIEDIDIKSPNITTPYFFIDHVLADFRVQLSILKMQLTMYEHSLKKVDPQVFEVPEDYVPVSRESMEGIINSLFTKE